MKIKMNFYFLNFVLERFVDAKVENLKATCKAPGDVKDFSAMVPESFFNGRRFFDRARIH